MSSVNPLLYALSNINEIQRFGNSLTRNVSSVLVLSSAKIRSYFIGAISLNNKLVVISDDSFALYHESVGVSSLHSQYLPTYISDDIFPESFSRSRNKYVQAMGASLAGKGPSIIFTEGGLEEHVPRSVLSKKSSSLRVQVNDRLLISNMMKTLNEYGYDENVEAKNMGEFARRGGIVDVFPTNTINPIRVEFNDDVISSLRYYNPTSQVSIETTNSITIPTIIKDINKVLSITYRELFDQLGYSIVGVQLLSGACKIEFIGNNNIHKTETIKIKDISIKTDESITKYKQKLTAVYVVGDSLKQKDYFPNNSIYIDGYINGNIFIYDSGIAIIKNDKIKKVNKNDKRRSEEYFYSYKWGDYVTHIDYGVGIYRGLVKKHNKDYITLEYANNSNIHLSAQHIDMIAPLV